jgi:flagellar hook protein FlgE
MGIYNALFTGASGLTAFGNAVSVVGDNIANVNSLGFKSQTVNFADVFGQTVGVTKSNIANQVGNGVTIGSITRNEAQGSVQSTSTSTDMAINGQGLFVLKDPNSGNTVYSRAGAFLKDSSSNLVNAQGYKVQGWALDSTGKAIGSVTNINLGSLAATAQATSNVTAGVNLDSTATAIPTSTTFSPTNASTYNYKSDSTVYDSLGGSHTISYYFVNRGTTGGTAGGPAVWDWYATVPSGDLAGGTGTTPTVVGQSVTASSSSGTSPSITAGTQSLTFDSASGALTIEKSPTMTINWANAAPGSISTNFGSATTTDAQNITGTGTDGTIQLAGNFATRSMTADGFTSGFLSSLETDSTGRITGVFTNGQRRPLYQLAMANFPNPGVMNNIGDNMMAQTNASGSPVIDKPGNAGMGTIQSNALEQSNVDLANEFTKLITIQHGYEANSKTVLTTDQMLSTLMSIKR